MKTIFTLFASLILSIAAFATDIRAKSMLTIKSTDRGSIRVIIDGRRFEPNDNYLRIQGIEAGSHNIKIYRERNTGLFNIFGRMYEVVFSSSLRIKPFTSVMISVDRFGRTTVNENRMNSWYGRNERSFGNIDDRSWDSNHDFDYDHSRNQGDYDKGRDWRLDNNGRDGQWGNQSQDTHDGRYDGRDDKGYNDNSYNKAISDFDFSRVLSSIQKEWSETNKMRSASQIISTNFFTTVQVKQMLQMFSLENNKLDLAEQAYSKTVDQRNYFMINDVFSSSFSKDELARYIRSH